MSLLDHQTISTSTEVNERTSKSFQEKVIADKVRQFKAVSEYNIRVVTIEQSRLIGRFVQKLKRSETIVKQHNKIKANLLNKHGEKSKIENVNYNDDNKLLIKQNVIQNEAEIKKTEKKLKTVKKRSVNGIQNSYKGTKEEFDHQITALLVGKGLPDINNINKLVHQKANKQEKRSLVPHDERIISRDQQIKSQISRDQQIKSQISRDQQTKSHISHDRRMISRSDDERIKSQNLSNKSMISISRNERIKYQMLRDKSNMSTVSDDPLDTSSQLNIEHYKSMYVSMKKRVSLQKSKKIYLSQPFKN